MGSQTASLDPSLPARPLSGSSAKTSARVLYLDVLRALAGVCVIFIHTTADLLYQTSAFHTTAWRLAVILNSASRWCVPVYVMLSGAFLLDYRRRYTTREFYSKRFLKVAVPFVAWTVIYLVWSAAIGGYHIHSLHDLVLHTISNPAMYHLWFFYMILGLYAVTPILSLIVQSASRPLLWAFVVVCFASSALGLISRFSGVSFYFAAFIPPLSYVGYFILGWLLKNQPWHIGFRALIYVVGAACVVLTAILVIHLSLKRQVLDTTLLDYQLPTILFESTAVFVFIRSLPWERILRWRVLLWLMQSLALSSFGIYLAHVLVKYYVNHYTSASLLPIGSTRYILLGAPLIYVLTAVIIVIARRLPWSYWLIP